MGKTFINLWVFNEKGKILFDYVSDVNHSPERFGDMLIAFNSLIEELSNEELSSMEMSENLITINKKNDLLFAGCSSLDIKIKKAEQDLGLVSNRFLDIYSKILIEQFKDDRSIFINSEKRFNDTIKEFVK